MSIFSKFKRQSAPPPSGPIGERAYVIGDVHGCMDALQQLLEKIQNHNHAQKHAKTTIIFLGDLIDRGPDSRAVVEFLSTFAPNFAKVEFLMGNHEEVFLSILSGDSDSISSWFGFGGRACARSYGVENLGQVNIDPTPLFYQLKRKVPKAHVHFISSFKDYHVFGNFLCVHAGIRPKVKLENQKASDFRWIRSGFLKYEKPHSHIVVHGHTIVDLPTHYGNRIAIDTGAYKTSGEGGLLTALCIDENSTEFLSVKANITTDRKI